MRIQQGVGDGPEQVVTFTEYHLPGLTAGSYTLRLGQTVRDEAGGQLNDQPMASEYRLSVAGDRFSLAKPAETLFCTFPDDNASGEYGNVLPHAVFTSQTLPWSRQASGGSAEEPGRATWLGVLLLDEDDVPEPGRLKPVTGTLADLFPRRVCAQSNLPDDTLSYFRDAPDTSVLELGETTKDPLQYLDLPLALFWRLAPTLADLHYLAHARRVDLKPKPTLRGVSDVGEPLGDFAIVFGNRLPQRQKQSSAFLVSFEGLGPLLPTDAGHPDPAGATAIRLAVLSSWRFFSTGSAADFDDRMLALNGRTTGNQPPDAANTNLRLSYGGDNAVVEHALEMGYVPLNQTLRTGEANVSWYRGPLVPYGIDRDRPARPVASPDQVMAFDPTTGMLDESLAAAWTAGRLLSLQDRGFSTALYAWKKALNAAVHQGIEAEMLTERFGALLTALPRATERVRDARVTLRGGAADGAAVGVADLRSLVVHSLLEAE